MRDSRSRCDRPWRENAEKKRQLVTRKIEHKVRDGCDRVYGTNPNQEAWLVAARNEGTIDAGGSVFAICL